MQDPPEVKFADTEPLQNFYDDGTGAQWSVAALLDDAKDLPVFDCPLAAIDLSGAIWSGADMFNLAFHVKRVMEADLEAPILLDWRGCIADGRHRVIKALALGKRTVPARRMTWRPNPCRTVGKEG